MKNLNKVRTYWGFNFIFEDSDMIDKFLELYGDLIISYERNSFNHPNWLKIRVGKGVINEIKTGLGDSIEPYQHKRYFVKGRRAA